MSCKIAILHQGFIPTYRVRFYQLLNRSVSNRYVVFHGAPPSNTGHHAFDGPLDFPNIRVRNLEISLLRRVVIYQCVVSRILRGSFAAVVLGHETKFISSMLLFVLCKLLGKPVIWWGHGFEKDQQSPLRLRFFKQANSRVKTWLARAGYIYIVYTAGGARKLKEAGLEDERVVVINNTLDMEEQRLLHAKLIHCDPMQFRQKAGLASDSLVLLYVGRLYKEKRLEELLWLVEQINAGKLCKHFVEAVFIGNGPEFSKLKEAAGNIRGIHFLGEQYDQEAVARYMRLASALVIPGKVGLAVNHAFAHGLPVITRESTLHAPEVEYIQSGENGLIVRGEFNEFVQAVVEYLNSPSLQKKLSENALRTGDSLGLDFMVKTFDAAVSAAIQGKSLKQRRWA